MISHYNFIRLICKFLMEQQKPPVMRPPLGNENTDHTVNAEIFGQYIFSCITCGGLDARKFDLGENYNHNITNRIKWYVSEI